MHLTVIWMSLKKGNKTESAYGKKQIPGHAFDCYLDVNNRYGKEEGLGICPAC